MKEIKIKSYAIYMFGIAIFIFVLNKLYLRSWIIENNFLEIFQIITYSIPNTLEAVIGTFILTGLFYQIKIYLSPKFDKVKDLSVHLIAVSLAALYVILQELRIHNLGGNNVYDLNDLLASILGLVLTFVVIQRFGFIKNTS